MKSVSSIDSRITLDFLKHSWEGQYFERKWIEELGMKPTKLANEIIGMLNADGGIIALGVSNKWEIQNLNTLSPDIIDQYRKIFFDFIKPPANIYLEEITLDTWELLFLYHIDQDYERVFSRKDNENIYLRISDSNKWPLNRDEVRKLEYDRSIRKFEDELRDEFVESDFRKTVLDYYIGKLNFSGDFRQLLLSRHLATEKNGRIIYKNAAILLFSEDPEKYIPSASVRYIRYEWVEEKSWLSLNITKDESFIGCIPRLIELLKKFVYASLRDYYYLDISAGKFIKISEYPEEAWLEGIVNALCHRSYNIQWNRVYIKHFDDRIEISNSWPLPAQVTIENICTTRFSRNPRIARVLTEIGYVRELNEWVKRIYESMEKSMLSEPEYTDTDNTVTLILRNKVSSHKWAISEIVMKRVESLFPHLNATEKHIIQHLFEKNEAKLSDLFGIIWKSEPAIRNALNKLIELDILVKNTEKQRDKNAMYLFKKT